MSYPSFSGSFDPVTRSGRIPINHGAFDACYAPDSGGQAHGPTSLVGHCSGGWMPPPEYRNTEASDQGDDLEADLYPVPDRGGISISDPARRVEKQPVQKITIGDVHDFSLDEAVPYFAVAVDAQIDRDGARDNFIKKKLHADIRSSRH
jgi:hypothetical protein